MCFNVTEKIINQHLLSEKAVPGEEISIRIDQTLTHDATGTMAFLQFEAMGVSRVKTQLSVTYIDHNTLQTGFENADDHRFLQDMAAKSGAFFSRPGNGICHQVHLESFGAPGKTLLGSDSHTPLAGGLGMLGIGVGGLDVAVAMAGGPFYLVMPKVINIRLHGKPDSWVSAKDIILEVLRCLSVKGGVNAVLEYSGGGLRYLSVPERATITNMGAETGATSSIFPSDQYTREFLAAQGREKDWQLLEADEDAHYQEVVDINLDQMVPLVACPHSPDNVRPVSELAGMVVDQVMIGSCTNSSYLDLSKAAAILKGRSVHPGVNLVVAPGSRQVLSMISNSGALTDIIKAGARILECACGPCIGMGQAPPSGSVSLRTINRNFKGRSGTADAMVYLVSPETAAASAVAGCLVDPRSLGEPLEISIPECFNIDSGLIIPPPDKNQIEVRRGPNIKPLPVRGPLPESLEGEVLIKVGDNITTDHIMPAGAKVLPLRSNIPAMAEHVFSPVDPEFTARAKSAGGGLIVGGDNYGQGSSREHAALAPMYLGVSGVLARSFARIHRDNLINFGIVPFVFSDAADYELLKPGERLQLNDIRRALAAGRETVPCINLETGKSFNLKINLTDRQRGILLAGGTLNWVKTLAIS